MLSTKVATLTIAMYLITSVAGEVCYVCGNDKTFITNPDNKIPIPEKYESSYAEVDCKTLAVAGMKGLILEDACAELHDSTDFKTYCGCSSINSDTNDNKPTGFPAMEFSPTFEPSEIIATFILSEANDSNNPSPSMPKPSSTDNNPSGDTQKPTRYIPPTRIPIEAPTNNEQTELPSTDKGEQTDLPSIDGVIVINENVNDDALVTSSVVPSYVPSSTPSDSPSDAPSDMPSSAPSTADRDVSGAIAESSANTAAWEIKTKTLATVIGAGLMFILLE